MNLSNTKNPINEENRCLKNEMSYKQQLKIGKKVEREHRRTYLLNRKKKLSKSQFYESIAQDHLKEDKNYYTRLKKAGL